jgi:SlyX protein
VSVDARIELLEFKVAHLERALQELSDVLYRQQRELDAARARAQQLVEQVQQLESRDSDATAVEIPPHY